MMSDNLFKVGGGIFLLWPKTGGGTVLHSVFATWRLLITNNI